MSTAPLTIQTAAPRPIAPACENTIASAPSVIQWTSVVDRVQENESSGLSDLYRLLSNGFQFLLFRQLGAQDAQDRLHNVFLIVVDAIQRGDLRESERLPGFVRTVAFRQISKQIRRNVKTRNNERDASWGMFVPDAAQDPEEQIMEQQKLQILRGTLAALPARSREVLVRFYVQEQSPAQICADLNLTQTQFRLLKTRAKACFGKIGRRKLRTGGLSSLLQ